MYAALTAVYQPKPISPAANTAAKTRSLGRPRLAAPADERRERGHDRQHADPDRQRARRPEPVVDHPHPVEAGRDQPLLRLGRDGRVEDDQGAREQHDRADPVPARPAGAPRGPRARSSTRGSSQARMKIIGTIASSPRTSGAISEATIAAAIQLRRRVNERLRHQEEAERRPRVRSGLLDDHRACRRAPGSRRSPPRRRARSAATTTIRAST